MIEREYIPFQLYTGVLQRSQRNANILVYVASDGANMDSLVILHIVMKEENKSSKITARFRKNALSYEQIRSQSPRVVYNRTLVLVYGAVIVP